MPHSRAISSTPKKRVADSPARSIHGVKRRRADIEVVHVDSSLPAAIAKKQPRRAESQQKHHLGPPHDRKQEHLPPDIEFLKTELAAKSEIIEAQTTTLNQLHAQLTCQICLDILSHPFAIVPCGHVSCFYCLESWFRQPPNPDDHGLIRVKTCPHCRGVVTTAPIALYILKSVISLVHSARDLEQTSSLPSRPPPPVNAWDDLFPVNPTRYTNRPIVDHDDGGVSRCEFCLFEIWGGECSGCGLRYDVEEVEVDDSGGSQSGQDDGSYDGSFIDDADVSFPQMQLFDIGAHYDPDAITRSRTPDHETPIVDNDVDTENIGEEGYGWRNRRRARLLIDTDSESDLDDGGPSDQETGDRESEDGEGNASGGSDLSHSDSELYGRQF